MKIALVGATSTGKTTLAKYLAEYRDIKFVSVQTADYFKTVGIRSHSEIKDLGPVASRRLQQGLMQLRDAAYREASGNIIVDRSAIDAWVYYVMDSLRDDAEVEQVQIFKHAVIEQMKRFDYIVILPFGVIPYEFGEERRMDNVEFHALTQMVYEGFIRYNLFNDAEDPPKVLYMPDSVVSLEDRAERIIEFVNTFAKPGEGL